MGLGFRGEVADFYRRYRRGYPPAVIDTLVTEFALTPDDTVADLGCGTGQLAIPLAARVGTVIGIDPEPDMLANAHATAPDLPNVEWSVGKDSDLTTILAGRPVAAVTIGQALHWMDHETLFPAIAPLLRPGGGIAVIANGKPLWQHDSDWSRALRSVLRDWFGGPLTATCGTDDASRDRYAAALHAAGYRTRTTTHDHTANLDLDQIIGGVYSATPADRLPTPADRPAFAATLRTALAPHHPYLEPVRTTTLTAHLRTRSR